MPKIPQAVRHPTAGSDGLRTKCRIVVRLPSAPKSCWRIGGIQSTAATTSAARPLRRADEPAAAPSSAGRCRTAPRVEQRGRQPEPEHQQRVAEMGLHEEGTDPDEPRERPELPVREVPGEEHEREEGQHRHPGVPRVGQEARSERPGERQDRTADEHHERQAPAAAGDDQGAHDGERVEHHHADQHPGRAEAPPEGGSPQNSSGPGWSQP